MTWNLWLAASEDRSSGRYWQQMFLREAVALEEITGNLMALLNEAKQIVEQWTPDDLEFATELEPLP